MVTRWGSKVFIGVALLLAPICAQAQVEGYRAFDFFNLTGGLNDTSDPTSLSPAEASDLQNVTLSTSGGVKKRNGFTPINASAIGASATMTGLAFYKQADGTRFLVATVSNGATDTIQKMDYGVSTSGPDGTWDDITGALSLSFADDTLADFAVAENKIVIEDGDGTTPPYVWDGTGTAVALGGSPPNASMVEYHKRILWEAGRTDARSRVDFSNVDSITTWTTATDFIFVETDDGQVITGLKSGLDCLYVFKSNSIWRICGTNRDDFTLEQMVRGVGAASNQSIALINNQFVFLTNQGDFAVYDGGINVKIISQKIEGTLSTLNINRFSKTIAAAFDIGSGSEDYYACVSASGNATHNRVLIFDVIHTAWTKFTGINCNALAVYEVGTTQQALAFADYTGRANRYPNGDNDAGAAIAAYYQSGHLKFDVPQPKTFRTAQVFVKQEGNYNLTFERRIDFASSGTQSSISLAGTGATWDSAVWDTDAWSDLTTNIQRIEIDTVGDFIQWRVENNHVDEPFLLRGVRIWAEPTERI